MNKIKTQLTALACLALLGAGCASTYDVSEYPVLCEKEKYASSGECGSGTALSQTTYRVDYTKQEVISWMPGTGLETNRYTKCAILNINQWSCRYDDESGTFGFSEGRYYQIPTIIPNKIYVTREEWEKYRKD